MHGTRRTALQVGLFPTLPFHAGVSMQAYAAGLMESLAGMPRVQATLLAPRNASQSGVGWARLRIFYESIPSEFWLPANGGEVAATRARLGIGAGGIAVLPVRSNDARKNLPAMCRVVSPLPVRQTRAVRLLKVGAPFGPVEQNALRRTELPDNVMRHAGRVDLANLVRICHAATVLLYPSFDEGFCRAIVEAMAAGLPVLAPRGGAIPKVAENAATLYEPNDAESMAERIDEIAEDPGRHEKMPEAGRHASRRFAVAGHGRTLTNVYQEVTPR